MDRRDEPVAPVEVKRQRLEDDEGERQALRMSGFDLGAEEPDLFLLDWGEPLQGVEAPLFDAEEIVSKVEPSPSHPASAPAILQHPAAKTRPHHTPVELEAELENLLFQVEQLERRLGNVAANVVAQMHAQEPDWPNDTADALQAVLAATVQQVEQLPRDHLLTVNALYKLDSLKLRLALVREQLRIYRSEIAYLATRDVNTMQPAGFVSAVFVKQPRSQPVKRRAAKKGEKAVQKNSSKTKAQFEYRVRVLTGAVVTFAPLPDTLQSSLVLVEDNRAKLLRGSAVGLTLLSPVWSEGNSVLSFAAIFSDGTQVVPAELSVRFAGTLCFPTGNTAAPLAEKHVEFATVNPNILVITTNENQWEAAEGRVLRRALFGPILEEKCDAHALSTTWLSLCNCIGTFFARATRQDLINDEVLGRDKLALLVSPQRPLTAEDFAFLHERKFGSRPRLTLQEFNQFWEWFGALTHNYRHNHVVRAMYLKGLIYGFISKDTCAAVLRPHAPGTFLIRHSEGSLVGEFALAFTNAHRIVKHHKIDHKKLRPPYGNLADFVHEKDQLSMLVKPLHEEQGTVLHARVIVKKNDAMAEFYTKSTEGGKDDYTAYLH